MMVLFFMTRSGTSHRKVRSTGHFGPPLLLFPVFPPFAGACPSTAPFVCKSTGSRRARKPHLEPEAHFNLYPAESYGNRKR